MEHTQLGISAWSLIHSKMEDKPERFGVKFLSFSCAQLPHLCSGSNNSVASEGLS